MLATLETSTIIALDDAAPWARTSGDPRAAMAVVRALHSTLTPNGLGREQARRWGWSREREEQERASLLEPARLEHFLRAARFLSAHAEFATPTFNRRRTSYGWKHVAERWAGGYVSNGALIASAVALGFRVDPIEGTPNAHINLAERAVRRVGA